MDARQKILGVPVDNGLTMDQALDLMLELARGQEPVHVAFTNAHCANVAQSDADYLAVLYRTRLNLVDGSGMALAGKLLNRPVTDNVNGTDLFPLLIDRLAGTGIGLYLLGARPGVVDAVADYIADRQPQVIVSGRRHGYFKPEEEVAIVAEIAASGARILLVCLGVPGQEKWIDRNLDRLGVGLASGVGGLFDFYSGRIPRAPMILRKTGMEWSWRLMQEPGRMWRRYLIGNIVFLWRVMMEKLGARREPRPAQSDGGLT